MEDAQRPGGHGLSRGRRAGCSAHAHSPHCHACTCQKGLAKASGTSVGHPGPPVCCQWGCQLAPNSRRKPLTSHQAALEPGGPTYPPHCQSRAADDSEERGGAVVPVQVSVLGQEQGRSCAAGVVPFTGFKGRQMRRTFYGGGAGGRASGSAPKSSRNTRCLGTISTAAGSQGPNHRDSTIHRQTDGHSRAHAHCAGTEQDFYRG